MGMAANEPKPSEVTVRAEAPPAPAVPAPVVTVVPLTAVERPVQGAADNGVAELKAEIARLHSRFDQALARPEPPKEEPKEEPVVAVAPPPPPPDPPDTDTKADTGPRKRGFLERLLHAGCPD